MNLFKYFLPALFLTVSGCSTMKTDSGSSVIEPVASADGIEGWVLTEDFNRNLASKNDAIAKCVKRIKKACSLSNNNEKRILGNAKQCKQVTSGSGKTDLQVILLRGSENVVTVKTRGEGVSKASCPVTKYEVDDSGIDEVVVADNQVFLRSDRGRVYYMYTDGSFYELYTRQGLPYNNVKDIKGSSTGEKVVFKFTDRDDEGFRTDWIQNRKTRKLNFFKVSTDRSLFRDE